MNATSSKHTSPALAVVVPVHNETENLAPLIGEIRAALASGPAFEIVYVDDGSTDETLAKLIEIANETPPIPLTKPSPPPGPWQPTPALQLRANQSRTQPSQLRQKSPRLAAENCPRKPPLQ